LKCISHSTN